MTLGSDTPADVVQTQYSSYQELVSAKIVEWLRSEELPFVDPIDPGASLLEFGIDSIGVATIAGELEQETGKIINPEVLYEMETIGEVAEYLKELPVAANGRNHQSDVAAVAAAALEEELSRSSSSAPSGLLSHYARLNRRVKSLKEQGRYYFEPEISGHDGAWVVADGKRMLMLASYEYLGLLGHPHLKQAAIAAIEQFGTGHHGARLLAGTATVHRQLEAKLASFMGSEDAIVFSSGFVTNLATISSLVVRGDCVIGDQWNHASIVDGCRFSGAELLEFAHNDMNSLDECLAKANGRRTLVVVDSVFSMDGDIIDLPEVVRLCRKHGALLMVDEAHSLGVLGKTGHGIQEHFNLGPDAIDVKMGTLSKTLASGGGFIAANDEIVTYLRHHARGYIFSGALPAVQVSAAMAALEVIERQPQLVTRLWENVDRYLGGLKQLGFDTSTSATPIVPVMCSNDEIALEMTRICREEGLLVIPVCFPAVPLDAPRLRTCISAIHSQQDIDFALDVLARAGRRTGLIS